MEKKIIVLIAFIFSLLLMKPQFSAADYLVSGAGADEVNGLYVLFGTYDTYKNEGIHTGQMPVYRKTGTNYVIGYRGCSTKWVILSSTDVNSDPPDFDFIGGGPGNGYIYSNGTDSSTPPKGGWESRHESPEPAPTVVQVPPSPPMAGAASVIQNTYFTANWSANPDATLYKLDVATDSGFTSFVPGYKGLNVPSGTSQLVQGLSPDTQYYYRVRCCLLGYESGNSNTIGVKTTLVEDSIPPDAPVITAQAGVPGSTAITLSWEATETALRRYFVWCSGSDITGENLNQAESIFCPLSPEAQGSGETFTIKGLSPGVAYYFAVKSEDAVGNLSGLSNVASFTTAQSLPVINSLELTTGGKSGDNSQARELKIVGDNFSDGNGNIVRFICPPLALDVVSQAGASTEIAIDVPVGMPVGIYRLKVINVNGESVLSSENYTVSPAANPLPAVTSVFPPAVPANANSGITINGSNFIANGTLAGGLSLIAMGGPSVPLVSFEVKSLREITATISANVFSEGIYYISVATTNGTNQVSSAKLEIYQPVDLGSAGDCVATTKGVKMPGDGIVPFQLSLSTDNDDPSGASGACKMEIEAVIEPGTLITSGGVPYTGVINPPRPVPVDPETASLLENPGSSAVFTLGASEALTLSGGTLFVCIQVTVPSTADTPSVYYFNATGSLEVAGVNGQRNGQVYNQGGTVLALRLDVPESGFKTYTLGLLLDHMSMFVLGNAAEGSPSPPSEPANRNTDYFSSKSDSCFISVLLDEGP